MRVVSRMSWIVATLRSGVGCDRMANAMPALRHSPAVRVPVLRGITALAALAMLPALSACGQRGPLYLPTVPPMPQPPAFMTQPASGAAVSPASATAETPSPRTPDPAVPATDSSPR
jgi:predicted small lipoprotein YifL